MVLTKSPSMTHPSCSVLSNRPVSSVEKLTMNSKIKSDTIVRPNSQPLKPSKIPSLIVKPERYSSVPNLDYLTSSRSTYTLKPTSAAHTRHWRPQSVIPQHVQSKSHLPNPKLAKLLNRGWKSGPILPSYPLAGPEYITPMSCPSTRSASSTKQTTINDTKSTNSTTSFNNRNNVDYSSSEHNHPKLYKKICCIPIPIFRSRSNVKLTANDDTYTTRQQPTAERCGYSRPGNFDTGGSAHLQQSRIPVARSTSPRGENINACKTKGFDSRPISAKSGLIRGTSKIPVLDNKVVTPLAKTPIPSFSTCLNTEVPRAQNVPSLKSLSERAVNEMSVKQDSYVSRAKNVPSLASMAERAVYEMSVKQDIPVSRAKNVPSLASMAERAVYEMSVKQDSYVSRAKNVPSLASMAERAVNEMSVKQDIPVSRAKNVPSLASMAERAVYEMSVKQDSYVSRAQNVPSLTSMAERAVYEMSVKQDIPVSRAKNVPSLASMAERAVYEMSVKQDIPVSRANNVPSLASMAERAVYEMSVKQDSYVSRAKNVPSLASMAERAVYEMSVKQDIPVSRAKNVPSLASMAERAVYEMSVKQDSYVSRAKNVPSLASMAERAVNEMSVKQDIHVSRAKNVPSLASMAERAVYEISVKQDIHVSRAENVPTLTSLAERAVSEISINRDRTVSKAHNFPSLASLVGKAVNEMSVYRDTLVSRAQNVPSLVSLAERAVNEISVKQDTSVSTAQDVPSLTSLTERAVSEMSVNSDPSVSKLQNGPSLLSLAERVVSEMKVNLDTHGAQTHTVPSLTSLAEKAVNEISLQQSAEVRKSLAEKAVNKMCVNRDKYVSTTQNVPSLAYLAEKAVNDISRQQSAEVQTAQYIPSLKSLAENVIVDNGLTKDTNVPRTQEIPSLKSLAKQVVNENNLNWTTEVRAAQKAPRLDFLAERVVNETNLKQKIEVQRAQTIPSLKIEGSKATDKESPTQNSKVHIAQTVAVDASPEHKIDGPKSQTVPSLSFLAEKVVTESSLKQNSDVHGVPSLKFLAEKVVDKNASIVTDKIVADLTYSESSFEQELESTSSPKVCDVESSVPSGKVSRTSDSKRQISCCSTRRSRPSTRESEKIRATDDAKGTKFESADKTAGKSDWNYYSTERALKKTSEATDVANGDKAKADHCAVVETKKKTHDSRSWRRTYELLKLPKSHNAASSDPGGKSTSASSVSLNLQISNVKEKTKEPTENATNTGRTKSCDNKQNDKKTPRSKLKKTIKRVADKVNRRILERLKLDRDDISNSDVFKMITAIHKEDDDATKMLEELKLINQLEEEQKNKMKNKVEEAQLVAEKGDFKHKVAGTNEKKKQMDGKPLCTLKKEPDNEDNLHKDRMTKKCREKKKFEKSHPELELQTKTEQQCQKRLKKTKEPKIKPKMTKNATRLQKENGHKVRKDKLHKLEDKFKNEKHIGKGKYAEASYSKEPKDNNYKQIEKNPKSTTATISTEKDAKFSSESLPINKSKTNTASSASSKQSKRQFLLQTDEDLKNKQNNSQEEKRNMRKRKDDYKKKDGPLSKGTLDKTAGASKQEMRHSAVQVRSPKTETKHETTQSTCIFPKINIPGSKTAPKPNGSKSTSSEQRALRINGGSKQSKTNNGKKQYTSKPKDTNRNKEVFKVQRESNSNIDGTAVAKPNKKINTNDDTQREEHEDHLRRTKMEPNTLNRYVVQRKAKPGYRNTQLPPLQLKSGRQPGANPPAVETQRMQRTKVSKQMAQGIKEKHTK